MRWITLIVLAVRIANADAPHGRYWLNVLDPPYPSFSVNDRALASCGDRTKPVLAKLHGFKVVYSRTEAPGKEPIDEVLVDKEPWTFDGFTTGPGLAMAHSQPSNGARVWLWFGLDQQKNIEGVVQVILWDGANAVCGDGRRLDGSYSSSLRPPRGFSP